MEKLKRYNKYCKSYVYIAKNQKIEKETFI